jgi:hypothetical protein
VLEDGGKGIVNLLWAALFLVVGCCRRVARVAATFLVDYFLLWLEVFDDVRNKFAIKFSLSYFC